MRTKSHSILGHCGVLRQWINRCVLGASSTASDVLMLLRLFLRLSCDTSYHTPDSILELTVLGDVDEWIGAAVDVHQHNAEVVEPVNGKLV